MPRVEVSHIRPVKFDGAGRYFGVVHGEPEKHTIKVVTTFVIIHLPHQKVDGGLFQKILATTTADP